MFQFKRNLIIYFLIIVLTPVSCSLWSVKEWKNLKDRNFVFKRFTIFKKGSNKKRVFSFMRDFEVLNILKILSDKYNIKINTDDFENFIYSGEVDEISSSGLFSDDTFIWENDLEGRNLVEFEYSIAMDTLGIYEHSYRLAMEVNGKVRESYTGSINNLDDSINEIAFKMGYKRVTEKNNEYYINTGTGKKILLTGNKSGILKIKQRKQKILSESEVTSNIKRFYKGLKPDEKKVFRDKVLKLLYNEAD